MGKPTIYKPSIYNGNGVYNNGASGGGGDTSIYNIVLEQIQGSRATPSVDNPNWPNDIGFFYNRITTQVINLSSFIGKKTKIFLQNDSYELSALDGTKSGFPFNSYSWNDSNEFIIEYGTITISMRKKDSTNLLPYETPIYLQLLES